MGGQNGAPAAAARETSAVTLRVRTARAQKIFRALPILIPPEKVDNHPGGTKREHSHETVTKNRLLGAEMSLRKVSDEQASAIWLTSNQELVR